LSFFDFQEFKFLRLAEVFSFDLRAFLRGVGENVVFFCVVIRGGNVVVRYIFVVLRVSVLDDAPAVASGALEKEE
jgi:hypothetical protein